MSDRWVYVLCGCAFTGGLLALSGPWLLGLLLLGVALVWRKPWLVCLAMLLATSFLAARAEASYQPIAQGEPYSGLATLASDPEPNSSGGWHAEISLPSGRHDMWVYGRQAVELRDRLAGERLEVSGKTRPLRQATNWHKQRHIVGTFSIDSLEGHSPGALHYRVANAFRRTLNAGAQSLSHQQLALFNGLVFGDDREQSALLTDDFLAGGLTHLLAVSGQNVVFVLLLARPLLLRLPHHGRWAATMVVLLLFATATRFESSVMRASAMAAIAATSALFGRQESAKRHLALAACALILLDPQIVHSLGFRLSVVASAGILFWAQPLGERIGGPRSIALLLAVTISAQLWVAPLLVLTFGGVPVGSLWANLLAVPVAGPLMMWGMTAGGLAGMLADLWDGALASALHLPTRVGISWLTWVAGGASRFWLGELLFWHVAVVGICVAAVLLAKRKSRSALIFGSLAVVVLVIPSFALVNAGPSMVSIGRDSFLWRGAEANVLTLGAETSDRELLEDLRKTGVKQLSLLVAEASTNKAKQQLGLLRQRYGSFEAWLRNGQIAGSNRRVQAGSFLFGDVLVNVLAVMPTLEVEVELWHGQI